MEIGIYDTVHHVSNTERSAHVEREQRQIGHAVMKYTWKSNTRPDETIDTFLTPYQLCRVKDNDVTAQLN